MKQGWWPVWVVALAVASAPGTVRGETTNGASIATQSVNFSCLDWSPIGVCVWLDCGLTGCSVNTTIKVRHYSPDVAVSTYKATGLSPWVDTRAMAPTTSFAQDGGSNKEGSRIKNETALIFNNVDVIGSPGVTWIRRLAAATGLYCDPYTRPYQPYLISTLNPFWRDPLVETPLTVANILREVRSGTSMWGAVYPRIGFVHQGHDYKAAAVAAQRAADIVTRRQQPHTYSSILDTSPAAGVWPPGSIVEGDAESGMWQQLVPSSQAASCRVFPDVSDQGFSLRDPFAARLNEASGYVFNLWRRYRCCRQAGRWLLLHTGD